VADLPFDLPQPAASRLAAALDVEHKLPRALEALGPVSGRDVILLGPEGGIQAARLADLGARLRCVPLPGPGGIAADDGSADVLVALWDGFRDPDAAALAEADRVLRPGGRLLVVHDYGRDDVAGLRGADAPEYASWSRRDGPFLRDGTFRIRVLHCFWTFASIEDARAFLEEGFGEAGLATAESIRRARLAWNVAIYHRWRGGVAPEEAA
jgi:SAM-dependent methyltransferase